jgi:hypothetical protein
MSLTILYRNPQRPDDAGMVMISGREKAAATIARLERRGFVVDKITLRPLRRANAAD